MTTDTEKIRRAYLPGKVKILFIGESAPDSGGFFYKGDALARNTQVAFERALNRKFTDSMEFLRFFMKTGCYFDDLSPVPVNKMPPDQRDAALKAGVHALSKRIDKYSPEKIIVVMKKIKGYVFEALGKSKLDDVSIHVLNYPGYSKRNIKKYINQLTRLVTCQLFYVENFQ